MTAVTQVAAYARAVPRGVNGANLIVLEAVVPSTITVATTSLTVAFPDGIDATACPLAAVCFTPQTTAAAAIFKPVWIANWDSTGTLTSTPNSTLGSSLTAATDTIKNISIMCPPAASTGGTNLAAGDIVRIFCVGS